MPIIPNMNPLTGGDMSAPNYAGNLARRQQDLARQQSLMSLFNSSGAVY